MEAGKQKQEIDFESIDDRTNFKYKESRLMAAYRDGYDFISEHIVKVYRKTQSLRETGKACGDISTIAVRSVLRKCEEGIRNPGGRVWSKLSKEDVLYIRSQEYVNNQIFIKLAKDIQEMITKRTGVKTTISVETIRDVWKKKTHKNI